MKKITMLMMLLIASVTLVSAAKEAAEDTKVKTVEILTSAVCGECKERIENELNYTKGVVFAELDVDTKYVTVKYKTKHISLDEVKQVIADLGYDADETKRNAEAFNKLPKCCQSEGHCAR